MQYKIPGNDDLDFGLMELRTNENYIAMVKIAQSLLFKNRDVQVLHDYELGIGVDLRPPSPRRDKGEKNDGVNEEESDWDNEEVNERVNEVVNEEQHEEGLLKEENEGVVEEQHE